jgi:hypothetical protein
VSPGSLVPAPLLDHAAEVHAAPAHDVLDGIARPITAAAGHTLLVQSLGHVDQRALRELLPYPAHDRGLLRRDHELTGVDEVPRGVAQTPVAERIVSAVAAILEEPPLHRRHPLGLEIALQLGGEAQLPVHVATGCPVESGAWEVGHEQRHLPALELVQQVEHHAGVAGEPREVVDEDRRNLTGG